MRLTKYTHACVRLEGDGGVLVIDPGTWSEPRALLGADAVLLTHTHADHADVLRLAGLGVPVYAPEGSRFEPFGGRARLEATPVRAGEQLDVAGFRVRAVGGRHAQVLDEEPVANLGYVVDGRVLHPGDSLYVPSRGEVAGDRLDLLLAPVHGSWLPTGDLLRYVMALAPRQVLGIHEHQLSREGHSRMLAWLRRVVGERCLWLASGESLDL